MVHEWIAARAGSEQVFEAIAQALPEADLFALSWTPGVRIDTGGRKVTTTFLDNARMRDRRNLTLPVMPLAWLALGKRDYDVVISSHHAFAHSNRLASSGLHLSYVHTPARYVWNPEVDERGDAAWMRPARAVLKRVDLAATEHVTAYAANSSTVRQRILDNWGRDSRVIYPPVSAEFFAQGRPTEPSADYVLGIGRWIGYKRLDAVIRIADRAGLPVKIAGRGPDRELLETAAAQARVPVELVESPTDEQLRELYQNARCLLFPTVEDFGMVPVEALAAGTPVVAVAVGGALDTVRHGETGLLASRFDEAELAELVARVGEIDRDECARSAGRFSRERFQSEILSWISDELARRPAA